MMLHPVEFRAHGLAREGLLQQNRKSRAGAAIAYPAEHEVDVGALGQEIADLAHEIGATVLIKRNVLHIRNLNACLMQAIRDCLEGNPAQCLIRRNRSSSAAAISFPSCNSAADEFGVESAFRPESLPEIMNPAI